MRGLLILGALAALGLAGGAAAQDDAAERTATAAVAGQAQAVEVVVGDVAYEMAEGEVFQVCVDGRIDDLDGSKLALRPFARTASDGWLAFPSFWAWATGGLADAERGDCFVLDSEGIAG